MRLYSKEDLRELHFPKTKEGEFTKAYVTACMQEGTERYISNVQTEVFCLQVDDYVFPVTVNDTEYGSAYVTSPYGVIAYAQEELRRFGHPLLKPLLMPLLWGLGGLLKSVRINRVVTVNNWMLSTNLYPDLSSKQIAEATELLRSKFPSHSILWRSLNPIVPKGLQSAFEVLPCRLIGSRQVYLFDPANESALLKKERWNIKADGRLIAKSGYEIIPGHELSKGEIPRLCELYNMLYLEKYTHYNPQFTDAFIRDAIASGLLTVFALRKAGRINAVLGYFRVGNVMTTPLVGYDTSLPQSEGLYRMITYLCIDEARRHNLFLHHSSGAAHFKRKRGMRPAVEYTAVFDSHLSATRRAVWATMECLFNRIGMPILRKYKL